MALISLYEISVTFGGPLLFDEVHLNLEAGERVALLGRNGTGKTTLMKVIAGQMSVDSGKIIRQQGVEITHLPQEIPADITGNVFDIVASGLGNRGDIIKDYHHVSHQLHTDHSQELMRKLERLQTELGHTRGWDISNQVENVIAQMKLDPESDFKNLSGGQKRRTLLAKALVIQPGILLLDGPTNHLDIDSITWLEGFLKTYPGTLLLVTHDRMFMRNIATRIIELDRGRLFSWSCDYETFLIRKQDALDKEAVRQDEFGKKLAEEEAWLRKGVKARRTRNEGRVKALERMREEKKSQRKAIGQVNMRAQEAALSGDLVIKVSHIGYSYGDNCIIKDFSTQIMRGDKIGVIGPHGAGKTTLLRLLLGQVTPTKGKVRLGTNLDVAYYDQLREQLDEEKTVVENVCGTGDTVIINGKSRHIIGYLQDFLFSPERARTSVKVLSGGERNRLFLARLFTRPSNVLVMDGDGIIAEYPGGYDDWLSQRRPAVKESQPKAKEHGEEVIINKEKPRPLKLSFKEEKELASLPEKIERLESERERLFTLMSDAEFFKKTPAEMSEAKTRLGTIEAELVSSYERWEYLEELYDSGRMA